MIGAHCWPAEALRLCWGASPFAPGNAASSLTLTGNLRGLALVIKFAHAPRTAGEMYGDVTLQAKREAIEKLPKYDVG